jgi:hypothetical protein
VELPPLRYIISGRIVPERTLVTIQGLTVARFHFSGGEGFAEISIQSSQVTLKIFSIEIHFSTFEIVSIAKQLISSITDHVGFRMVGSYNFALDQLTTIQTGDIELLSVLEPNFDSKFVNGMSFISSSEFDPFCTPLETISDPFVRMALEELQIALLRPSLTPMHCYFAIEFIRERHIGIGDKQKWISLRDSLNVSRDCIDYIRKFAQDQKHGKAIMLDGIERTTCIHISWEIVHRELCRISDSQIQHELLELGSMHSVV